MSGSFMTGHLLILSRIMSQNRAFYIHLSILIEFNLNS